MFDLLAPLPDWLRLIAWLLILAYLICVALLPIIVYMMDSKLADILKELKEINQRLKNE